MLKCYRILVRYRPGGEAWHRVPARSPDAALALLERMFEEMWPERVGYYRVKRVEPEPCTSP